ncbi:transcriptional regulator [Mycolicibacterium phlei]|uniref:TetR family transcriptional regulator n=1 Tax=Mycolicibacterium phlei DSM 43239 = CCUG 21000 TaxID=1226750 RepID=A0A5N5UQL4_MYCPH|nr:TetR family transcriptional regulator [Mycolicibacterium phlei]VEG08858.1 transcriptional regulator [Mycobacteroides chelonae]AMO60740.1 Tetracycline repressor protein class H [Mycolicibacterium phlei]EID15257.1 TetR family transcriptional regulator [Mycolicibacterium phlei RIVM601174]KAB7751387.1 TetR family transcriptional regulator [Mycolicibacterium phlei DSM 43239 = CCUG 21000]KXW68028.1 TetR family transcriptional regulator [Mycolicibacterium phlei DSM 43239 = CCUG 21000]
MPTAKTARPRRGRGSISADEIINGAMEVAAQVSIEHLSMPQLAKHLGVGVTSIYWYFRRKDDLLDAMTDRALEEFEFTDPTISAANWREALREHALTMRRRFLADPILCDLVLIRGQYGHRAMYGALQKLEQPIRALVDAGLTLDQAVETYGAISVHIRGSVVLERLQERTEGFPEQVAGQDRYIGLADDTDFAFILDSILDYAAALIAAT